MNQTTWSLERKLAEFEAKVIKSDSCWVWAGLRYKTGYGQTRHRGKGITTHRLAWILYRGEIPAGKMVLHTCDVRPCVNPDHLYIGTARENILDAIRRNRTNKIRGKYAERDKDLEIYQKDVDIVKLKADLEQARKALADKDARLNHVIAERDRAFKILVAKSDAFQNIYAAKDAEIARLRAAIKHMAGYWCDTCCATGIALDPQTNCGYACPDCTPTKQQGGDSGEIK
jgi:hypothetical protein